MIPFNQAARPPVIRRHRVEAPPEWAGRSILHLTDLHLIPGRGDGDRIAAGIEGARCDLLAITGDILEHEDAIGELDRILDRIDCRGPVVAVLGNHDLWGDRPFYTYEPHPLITATKALLYRILLRNLPRPERRPDEAARIRRSLESRGIRVYANEAVRIAGDAWILALDDPYSGQDDLAAALSQLPDGAQPLGLVHAPGPAREMVDAGAFLVLCGHTHGNQIYLPGTGGIYQVGLKGWQPRYGLFERPGGTILLSSGAGHIVPLRINVPPECWMVELVQGEKRRAKGERAARGNPALAGTRRG